MADRINKLFLVLALMCFFVSFNISLVFAVEVGGNITEDTVWTKDNSPYIVKNNVQVLQGVRLTIEPGVEVQFFSDRSLNIDGELKAIGKSDERIIFTICENQSVDRWTAIYFSNNSVDAAFDDAGNYLSGSAIINCLIEFGQINCFRSNPYIYNSTIKSVPHRNSYAGAIILEGCVDIHLHNNLITDNQDSGILIQTSNSAEIKNNIITNNFYGITFYLYSPMADGVSVSENEITQNFYGILFEGVTGLYSIHINNNNIYNNLTYSIAIDRVPYGNVEDIDATNNWWGVIDTNSIESSIFDYFDDITKNKIIYSPFSYQYIEISSTKPNLPPQANLGEDQIVFDTIVLDGTKSFDPDADVIDTLTYFWTVKSRKDSSYNQTFTGVSPTISNLSPGFYDVILTVIDDCNAADTDKMFFAATGLAYTPDQINKMVSEKDSEISALNLTISSMFTQDQLNQTFAQAEAAKDLIINEKDQTIINLNSTIASMYSQDQVDQIISTWDINSDGKIGLEEAINALHIVSGIRN